MSGRQSDKGPLVPIEPKRLETARKEADLTVSALARKAGVRQQTVDAMRRASGKRRCRQKIRDRLAKALGLPAYQSNGSRWLGGEDQDLYSGVKLFDGGGGMYLYQRSPAPVALARLRLIEQCREAWTRDQEQPTDATVPPRPRGIPKGARFLLLQVALEHLTSCVWWRDVALRGDMFPPTRAEYEAQLLALPEDRRRTVSEERTRAESRVLLWDEMSQAEREDYLKWGAWPDSRALTEEQADRIEKGLINAFTTLLETWFAGDAQLEFDRLVALATRRPTEATHA